MNYVCRVCRAPNKFNEYETDRAVCAYCMSEHTLEELSKEAYEKFTEKFDRLLRTYESAQSERIQSGNKQDNPQGNATEGKTAGGGTVELARAGIVNAFMTFNRNSQSGRMDDRWHEFIMSAVALSAQFHDKELWDALKREAKETDKKRGNADGKRFFWEIIEASPQIADENDWELLLDFSGGDAVLYGSINEPIVDFIVLNGKAHFAIDFFHAIRAHLAKAQAGKKDENARNKAGEGYKSIARAYLRKLLDDERVASGVLDCDFFRKAIGRKFAKDVETFVRTNFAINEFAYAETRVWRNVVRERKRRKNVAFSAAGIAVAVVAAVSGGVLGWLNSIDKSSVKIEGKGIIDTIYGDAPDLSAYTVTYRKHNGKEFTVPVTQDMLRGFDAEKVGNQSVVITFKGKELTVTIAVASAQLSSPELSLSGNRLVWNQIEHADGYAVYVTGSADALGDKSYAEASDCFYDFGATDLSGKFYAYVIAKGSGKYEDSAKSASYALEKLALPQDIRFENEYLVWGAVEGADRYMVTFNGTSHADVRENRLKIAPSAGENRVTVTAYAAQKSVISSVSDEQEFYKLSPVSDVAFVGGKIVWSAEKRAVLFDVAIDGQTVATQQRALYYDVSDLAQAAHEIEITCVPDTAGVVASGGYVYRFTTATTLKAENDLLIWENVGQSYDVLVDGVAVKERLGVASQDMTQIDLVAGAHVVCVRADGNIYTETISVIKSATPVLTVREGVLRTENGADGIVYTLRGSGGNLPFDGDTAEIREAGEYVIGARNKANAANEISSDWATEITVRKLAVPQIRLDGNKLVCANGVNVRYYLNGSVFDGDFSAQAAGKYRVTAMAVSAADNELHSELCAPLELTKLPTPEISYDKDAKALSCKNESVNGKPQYYLNGVAFDGDMTGTFDPGVYVITAKYIGNGADVIDSSVSNSVSVFLTDVTIRVETINEYQLRIDLNTTMNNLLYDCVVEYFDASGAEVKNSRVSLDGKNSKSFRVVYPSEAVRARITVTLRSSAGGSDTDIYNTEHAI